MLFLKWGSYVPFFQGIFLGIAAMALHEVSHVVTALALGIKVKRVGLNINGLYTIREAGSPKENSVIALSGPLMNLLLTFSWHWLPTFALANLCFGVCNLLPIKYSDGLRVLRLWQGYTEVLVDNKEPMEPLSKVGI